MYYRKTSYVLFPLPRPKREASHFAISWAVLLYERFVSFGTRPKRISLIQIGFFIIVVHDLCKVFFDK